MKKFTSVRNANNTLKIEKNFIEGFVHFVD